MPIMKKGRKYVNIRPKNSKYINTIMPIEDREVPYRMFMDFEEEKPKKPEKNIDFDRAVDGI